MKLLDSNILIYAARPDFAFLRPFLTDSTNAVSVIPTIETLGYPGLQPQDERYLKSVFIVLQVLDLSPAIIEKTIEIRRLKKITLGDALVAATALVFTCPLVTRNEADFKHLPGIILENPIP